MSYLRVELEQIAKKKGYDDVQGLVCHLLLDERMSFVDLTSHIKIEFGINKSYSAVYAALRKYVPENFTNNRFFQFRDDFAKSKGYPSFKAMLQSFVERKLNYREIAKELGQKSPINVKRFEKIYGIELAADKETKKAGFVNQARYRVWLERAKGLGFDTVEEALLSLKNNGKTAEELAEAFEVSPQTIWRRLKHYNCGRNGK